VFAAYSGDTLQLYKRRLDEDEAIPMPGAEGIAPFFSTDGASVGFWAYGKLKKVSLDGGPVVDVADVYLPFGAAWGPDETIVFSAGWGKGIARVADAGGDVQNVIPGSPNTMQMLPRILPGDHAMIYTLLSENGETSIRVHRFDTGEDHMLVADGADARFSPSGHLLFMREGVLMAAPFDAERATLTGAPVAVAENVMQAVAAANSGDETRAGQFDVAENGTLIYVTGGLYPWDTTDAYWADRNGSAMRIPIEGPILQPRVSPDGTRIAYLAQRSAISRDNDIWVYDIKRQLPVRLTHEGANAFPEWSPDSNSLVFGHTTASGEPHLALVAADGSHPPVPITKGASEGLAWPSSWSAANDTLVYIAGRPDDFEIWTLDMTAGGDAKHQPEPRLLVDGPSIDTHAALSPDGRWLAYASHETGVREVYVQRYPEGDQKQRISTGSGISPIWAPDGRQIFYWQARTLPKQVMAVDFDAAGDLPIIGAPRVLFEPNEYQNSEPVRGWDLSPDGERFVLIKGKSEPPVTQMHVVVNWTAELERRVPVE
jgi:serine/threonine-protein kinase